MDYSETYASVKLSEGKGSPAANADSAKPLGNRMGTPVVKGHPGYTIVECMKMALSKSIQSISMPEKARPLDPKKDFTIKTKVQFSGRGDDAGPCCKSNGVRGEEEEMPSFVFTDYSPMCYCHMRAFLKVEWKDLHDELCAGEWDIIPTPGKSAALLYFCGNKGRQVWVVKTMTSGESKFLRQILHRYYYHVKNNSYTLLPHFVGHHSIKPLGGEKITFIIMRNVFETPHIIVEKYDLKGSTVGRYASEKDRAKASCTLKDLDVSRHVCVGESRREILLQQIRRDCDFLHKAGIMDYSFLLGIFNEASGAVPNRPMYFDERCFKADDGGMLSEPGGRYDGEIYFCGIIDILQEFTTWKFSENIVQGFRFDRDKISAVPPKLYAQRFLSFLSSIII